MDLQVSVFLLLALFTAGHALTCYECAGLTGSCADQKEKTCGSGLSKCISSTTVAKAGDITSTVKVKDCAAAADCASGSLNFGIAKTSFECCNTDRCNVNDAPDPNTNAPNGKTCYTCDDKGCSNVLSCLGTEDRCITAKESLGSQTVVVKGCASKSICDATTSVRSVTSISCCEGNLCNGAVSVTQSFMFLCCSLLSFVLMH